MANTSRVKWIGSVGEYRIDWDRAIGSALRRTATPSSFCLAAAQNSDSRQTFSARGCCGLIQGTQAISAPSGKKKVIEMSLTRQSTETIVDRVKRDPKFAKALLDEAATLFLNGEPQAARLILRDLVNATLGFEGLAAMTGNPAKSLHRMLSKDGNPHDGQPGGDSRRGGEKPRRRDSRPRRRGGVIARTGRRGRRRLGKLGEVRQGLPTELRETAAHLVFPLKTTA
ncbi:MAG TPA: hypothetical protein VHX61_17810 [Rhizomicrobium sp.]|jgi:DNA-binding phage protein|nr:hypothetical protein [Rhizomicrobium sp.]